MSRVVIVLPSIVPDFTRECLGTLSPALVDVETIAGPPTRQRSPLVCGTNGHHWTDRRPDLRVIVVHNTPEHNLGVAGSWNMGHRDALATGADWLVLLSAAVRFGQSGGKDFIRWLDDFHEVRPDVLGVEAAGGLGWHCLAFPRHVLERVGRFDEQFYPAYFEDNDYSVRIQRAYDRDTHAPGFSGPLWPKVDIDARLESVAHGIRLSGVQVDMEGLRQRMLDKWGPDERYRTPYDRPDLDWTHTGPAPIGVSA